MPSSTPKQRRYMGAELARKRAGKKTKTGMSEEQLRDFASKTKKKKVGKGEGRPPTAGSSRPQRPFAPPDYAPAIGARRRRGLLDDGLGPPMGRGWRNDQAATQPIPDEPISRMGIGGARRYGRGEAMPDPRLMGGPPMDPLMGGTMTSSAMMPTAPVRPRPSVKRKRKPAATKAKAKKKTTARKGGY